MKPPLAGINVLDLSHTLAGPFAARIFADLGASVVKVEPLKGDETRSWPPMKGGESVYFLSVNRGLKSIAIDLKEPAGLKIVQKLAKKSHVVLENFRPGATERLGLDYKSILKFNPSIIYCSIRGFQTNSSYAQKPAYDLIVQALTGLMASTGGETDSPVRVSFALFDVIAGLSAVNYILACLHGRLKPAHVEIPMFDLSINAMCYIPMISLMTGKPVKRLGSAHPSIAPYQAFQDKDGKYFVVAPANEGLWQSFCDSLKSEDLVLGQKFSSNELRVEHRKELIPMLQDIFSRKSRDHWIDLFEKSKVPCAPVYEVHEIFGDPYVKESGIIKEMQHKRIGTIPQLVPTSTINNERLSSPIPPPILGEYTEKILKSVGYKSSTIERLKRDNVVL